MRPQCKTSVEDAEKLISDFFKSGKSRKSFCDENGIKLGTFHWWMKRHKESLKKVSTSVSPRKPFIQITPNVTPINNSGSESEIVIDLKTGIRIRWRGIEIPSSFCRLLNTLNGGAE